MRHERPGEHEERHGMKEKESTEVNLRMRHDYVRIILDRVVRHRRGAHEGDAVGGPVASTRRNPPKTTQRIMPCPLPS